MKRITLTLLMLCCLITACSRPQPVKIAIEKDGAKITVVAKHAEKSKGIHCTLSSKVELTIREDGRVSSNEGDEWSSVDQALEESTRMAIAHLEATIRAVENTDKE